MITYFCYSHVIILTCRSDLRSYISRTCIFNMILFFVDRTAAYVLHFTRALVMSVLVPSILFLYFELNVFAILLSS